MALLRASLCASPVIPLAPSLCLNRHESNPRHFGVQNLLPPSKPGCLELAGTSAAVALLSASLLFADSALSFKANLSNANLEGALATGNTSFKGSNITGADFTDVPLSDDQEEYLCRVADGVNSQTGNATCDTLLCKLGSIF